MSKSELCKIDGKEYTVKELRVKDVLDLYAEVEAEQKKDKKGKNFLELTREFLPRATDMKIEDIFETYPSDLEKLYKKFEKVNSVFFGLAQKLGLLNVIKEIVENLKEVVIKEISKELTKEFSKMSVGLSD